MRTVTVILPFGAISQFLDAVFTVSISLSTASNVYLTPMLKKTLKGHKQQNIAVSVCATCDIVIPLPPNATKCQKSINPQLRSIAYQKILLDFLANVVGINRQFCFIFSMMTSKLKI